MIGGFTGQRHGNLAEANSFVAEEKTHLHRRSLTLRMQADQSNSGFITIGLRIALKRSLDLQTAE